MGGRHTLPACGSLLLQQRGSLNGITLHEPCEVNEHTARTTTLMCADAKTLRVDTGGLGQPEHQNRGVRGRGGSLVKELL